MAVKDGYRPGFSRISITLSMVRVLAIRAPRVAEVGQEVTIKVVERHVHQPVARAEVYAVKVGEANEVTEPSEVSMVIIKADSTDSAEAEQYLALAKQREGFIGLTDSNGKISHEFKEAGRYVLVAIKDGFRPGFARIGIKFSLVRALAIRAPRTAEVDQPVTIGVTERNTHKPVSRVEVYAVHVDKAKEIVIEENTVIDAVEAEAHAVLVKERGAFIGWTDSNGKVTHEFGKTGRYILVAIKDGYVPGFSKINITSSMLRALAIRAPEVAGVGRPVTMKVVERHAQTPIAGAGIYAMKMVSVNEIAINSDNITAVAEEYEVMARKLGSFIGRTNNEGELTHRFEDAGRYVLVAVKGGYIPGFTRITIRPLSPLELSEQVDDE